MRYLLYRVAIFIFPNKIINTLGSSKILKPIRDWFFNRNRIPEKDKIIQWNDFEFHFFASPQVLLKASTRGIESSLTKAILSIIKKDSNIIDIGANFGFITIVLATFVKENGGLIYSFECENKIFQNFQASIKKNNLNNIKSFHTYLGEKNKDNIKTADSIIYNENLNIDLIKIDTDGSDLECLKGCSKIIENSHPVIVIEINDNMRLITKYVKKMGYNYFYNQFLKNFSEDKLNDTEVPNLIASVKRLH